MSTAYVDKFLVCRFVNWACEISWKKCPQWQFCQQFSKLMTTEASQWQVYFFDTWKEKFYLSKRNFRFPFILKVIHLFLSSSCNLLMIKLWRFDQILISHDVTKVMILSICRYIFVYTYIHSTKSTKTNIELCL